MVLEELGISGKTAIIVLIVLYFVIKWAVRKGIKEAYRDISYKKTVDDTVTEEYVESFNTDETGK